MDELQTMWDAHNKNTSDEQQLTEDQLKERLITKSNDALRKINCTMRNDAIFMALVTLGFIVVTFILNLQSKYIVSLLLLGMMVFLGVHYWVKHLVLNKYDFDQGNISSILTKKIKSLKSSRQLYLWGLPIFSSALYIYIQTILLQFNNNEFVLNGDLLLRYSLTLPFAFSIYFISYWLYKLLYGNEIDTLSDILKELNH